MTSTTRRSLAALICVLGLVAASCGGGGTGGTGGEADQGDAPSTTSAGPDEVALHNASYDLTTGIDQRYIAGVTVASGEGLAFGTVDFEFHYLGTREDPLEDPRPGPTATASFLPIPEAGGEPTGTPDGDPRWLEPSEVRGVYGAEGVRFDEAGFWRVVMTAEVDGDTITAETAFGVNREHRTPAPGDQAPLTEQPTAGAAGVEAQAIDSRAHDGEVPDPELHATTVADALAAGRPVLVVVSTPVYCVSRFCGPITDAISALASTYDDRAAFVHIEVWEDFEEKKVNAAALAWMSKDPNNQNLTEPWVFLVGADGTITHRWDNVATVAEMTAALDSLPA